MAKRLTEERYVWTSALLNAHTSQLQENIWVVIEAHHDDRGIDQDQEARDTDEEAEAEAEAQDVALLVTTVPDVHQAPTAAIEATIGTITTDDRDP